MLYSKINKYNRYSSRYSIINKTNNCYIINNINII